MDHRTFLASLSVEQRAALTATSNARGLRRLAFHWGAIAGLAALIAWRVPAWPVLMLPQGILLVFLFTLLHETSHDTPFRSEWLNRAVGLVSAFAIFLPPLWFRYFHFAHHRFTQVPGKDPELASPKPEGWPAYVRHVSGLPVWIGHFKSLLGAARGATFGEYVPVGKRQKVRDEARLMLVAYGLIIVACVVLQSSALLTIWLIPLLLGQPFLRLYLLAEHGRCPFVANMLENSRTTYTNRLVKLIAWNMPYHAEHHSYPGVPFHQLPQLHELIREHLKVIAPGYVAFNRDYVAGFRR